MGRYRSYVTVRDFSALATCYAELNGCYGQKQTSPKS